MDIERSGSGDVGDLLDLELGIDDVDGRGDGRLSEGGAVPFDMFLMSDAQKHRSPFAAPYGLPDETSETLAPSDGTVSRDSGLECLSPATGEGWISQDSGMSPDVSKDNLLQDSSFYGGHGNRESDIRFCRDSGIAESITQSLSSDMFDPRNDMSDNFESLDELEFQPGGVNDMVLKIAAEMRSNPHFNEKDLEFDHNGVNHMVLKIATEMKANPHLETSTPLEFDHKGMNDVVHKLAQDMKDNPHLYSDDAVETNVHNKSIEELEFEIGDMSDMVNKIAEEIHWEAPSDQDDAGLEFEVGGVNDMALRIAEEMRANPHLNLDTGPAAPASAWLAENSPSNSYDAEEERPSGVQVRGSMMYGSDEDEDEEDVDEESEVIVPRGVGLVHAAAPVTGGGLADWASQGSDEVEMGESAPVDHDRYGSDVEEVELGPQIGEHNPARVQASCNKEPSAAGALSSVMYGSDDDDEDEEEDEEDDVASEELNVLKHSSSDEDEDVEFYPQEGRPVGPGAHRPSFSDGDPIPRAANPTPISAMNMVIDEDTPPNTAMGSVNFDLTADSPALDPVLMPIQEQEGAVGMETQGQVSRGLESIDLTVHSMDVDQNESPRSSPVPSSGGLNLNSMLSYGVEEAEDDQPSSISGGLNLGSMLSYDAAGSLDQFSFKNNNAGLYQSDAQRTVTLSNVETGESSDDLPGDQDDPSIDIIHEAPSDLGSDIEIKYTSQISHDDLELKAEDLEAKDDRMTVSADAADLMIDMDEEPKIREESLERIEALNFFDAAIATAEEDIRLSLHAQDQGRSDPLKSPTETQSAPRKIIPDPIIDDPDDPEDVSVTCLPATEAKGEEDDFEFDVPKVIPRQTPEKAPSQFPAKPEVIIAVQTPSDDSSDDDELTDPPTTQGNREINIDYRKEPMGHDVSEPIMEEPPAEEEEVIRRVIPPAPFDGSEDSALSKAEEEWDSVQTITPGAVDTDSGFGGKPSAMAAAKPLISYHEVQDHMVNMDLTEHKSVIRPTIQRRGFAVISHALFGPPKMHRDLIAERDHVFCMATSQFNNDNLIHTQTLQTVYRRLSGSKFDCQRFGSHWEVIGFQGNDPATDLRGSGFLGLMQLLYLVTEPSLYGLAKDIYCLSLHETQNFPFSLMGINLTGITIQALREELLNKECNRHKNVLMVLNEFYAALYYHLYHIWKYQHKSIKDTGFVLKDVENYGKKNVKALMKNLEMHLIERRNQKTGQTGLKGEEAVRMSAFSDDGSEGGV